MPGPVDPSLADRLSSALRPDFTRTARARRVAAAVLVVLAGAAALRGDPAGSSAEVVVATADLSPGTTLSADDVRLERRWATDLPDGTQTELGSVVGATLAGPARRGEILTDVRVIGSRLAALSAGPDARLVPLPIADDAVLSVIRPGDVVDVLGADTTAADGARPRLLAAGAVVATVSGEAAGGRLVLVALPAAAATALAGASLTQTVTLTIR
jgi:Flp pilus assembly protein CpaB